MKKFFLTLSAIFALSSSCLAATQTGVTDYNLDEFYRAYNTVAAANQNNFTLNEFPIKMMSGGVYDTYAATCGQHGHAVVVGFFANREGRVAKITLTFNGLDDIACDCSSEVFRNVLTTLGMTKKEMLALLKGMRAKNQSNHYCAAAKRFIIVEFSSDQLSGVVNLRLTAAVN